MLQGQGPTPPVPPRPPSLPGGTIVTTRIVSGTPLSAQEVSALLARRKILSDQVTSATARRRDVARQLRTANGADKAGLEQRLTVLDARIARLESDIDETGRLLSDPTVALKAEQQQPIFSMGGTNATIADNAAPLMALLIVFVLFPIAISIARGIWKRASRVGAAAAPADTSLRLERMEQAIDAVAIEIERISEGQRFVTRLLAEGAVVPREPGEGQLDTLARPRPERTPL